MAEEKKEVALKESNTPALLGFIFSLTICLYFPGLILSIIGLCTAKNYKKDRKGLAIAGVIISGILLIASIGMYSSGNLGNTSSSSEPKIVNKSSNAKNKETKKEGFYKIGDTISYKKYEITIENVSTANEVGSEYLKSTPAEGGIYVCVDFKYKNISDEPMSMFSFPSIKLVDSKGTKYSNDISASSYYATQKDPDRKVLSDLNPGITVTDNDVYEISSDSYNNGEWYLLIDNAIKVKVK